MREILFRGKVCDKQKKLYGKEWAYGYLYMINSKPNIKADEKFAVNYEVIPETVGQYTGLTDKNGKKIFEGDVVKGHISEYAVSPNRIGKVRWGAFGWIIEFNAPEHKIPRVGMCSFADIEVIGNIYDNPELLEVEE